MNLIFVKRRVENFLTFYKANKAAINEVALGVLAWLIVALAYPLEAIVPIYANY